VFFLSSCLGIKSGIVINNDGSGTIDLAYTISSALDSLGTQDGNVSQPPVPVSKSDFEKTVSQIDGLSLTSYKSETDESNVCVSVQLDFANIDALAAFFDESGQTFQYKENGNQKELVFIFNDAAANVGAPEQTLFTKVLEGYMFDFSIKTHGNILASFVDQNGNDLQQALGIIAQKTDSVSYQVPMTDLVFAKEPIILKIVF
jgi:hypothetical protein